MTLAIGDTLPEATFTRLTNDGLTNPTSKDLFKGKKVVLFGLPGAFTSTCSKYHMPSFVRTADAFREKGYDGIYCVVVNDQAVANAWEKATGAAEVGIEVIADMDASFTKAIGLDFTAEVVGFWNRCTRFAALVDDGVVTEVQYEKERGTCELTAGENLLDLA